VPKSLLDTDTLSAVIKQNPTALSQSRNYLTTYSLLTFSLITRYEILRGLKAKNAVVPVVAFERLCTVSEVLPLTDGIVQRAAEIYGVLHQQGQLIGDADILIAATAIEHGLTCVTNNENHFQRIPNLIRDNWLKP
jgi:tRNA(fMet)-specific endonuclease VapC